LYNLNTKQVSNLKCGSGKQFKLINNNNTKTA